MSISATTPGLAPREAFPEGRQRRRLGLSRQLLQGTGFAPSFEAAGSSAGRTPAEPATPRAAVAQARMSWLSRLRSSFVVAEPAGGSGAGSTGADGADGADILRRFETVLPGGGDGFVPSGGPPNLPTAPTPADSPAGAQRHWPRLWPRCRPLSAVRCLRAAQTRRARSRGSRRSLTSSTR